MCVLPPPGARRVTDSSCPITSQRQITPAAVAAKAIPMPHGYLVRGSMIFKTVGDEVIPVSEYLLYPSRRYKDDHSGKSMCLVEVNFPKAGWGTVPLEMDTLGGSTKDFTRGRSTISSSSPTS